MSVRDPFMRFSYQGPHTGEVTYSLYPITLDQCIAEAAAYSARRAKEWDNQNYPQPGVRNPWRGP